MIKDLNIRAKTIKKLLEGKHREKALLHWVWQGFLGYEQRNDQQAKINKLDIIKIKNLCASKDINKVQIQLIEREKYLRIIYLITY